MGRRLCLMSANESQYASNHTRNLTAHQLAQEQMIEHIKGKLPSFKENDLVWLDSRNLKTTGQIRKFSPRREGPFKIAKILGPVNVKLELPPRWKIHPVFH